MIKQGDLIVAYHKGFHEVLSVEKDKLHGGREIMLVTYVQRYNSNGKPFKGKSYQCNLDFCQLVTPELLDELIAERQSEIDSLKGLKNGLK